MAKSIQLIRAMPGQEMQVGEIPLGPGMEYELQEQEDGVVRIVVFNERELVAEDQELVPGRPVRKQGEALVNTSGTIAVGGPVGEVSDEVSKAAAATRQTLAEAALQERQEEERKRAFVMQGAEPPLSGGEPSAEVKAQQEQEAQAEQAQAEQAQAEAEQPKARKTKQEA